MAIQKGFQNRAAGFYLGLVGGVLAILALIFYIMYANRAGIWNMLILVPLVVSILIQASSVVVDSDVLTIISPVLGTLALGSLLMESVYTFVGYIYNLAMFGDVTLMGPIVRVCIAAGASIVVMLAAAFLKKNQAD